MKKIAIVLVTLILAITVCACGQSSSGSPDSKNDKATASSSKSMSESEVKRLVLMELLVKIRGKCSLYDYDINKTTYSISSIEDYGGMYTVSGSYTLYDSNGYIGERNSFSAMVSKEGTVVLNSY